MLLFGKYGVKGAAGSKNAETDKSPIEDGDAPPPKLVSSVNLPVPFVLLHKKTGWANPQPCFI
jgi:hypothetical protein